ncbi:MAG: hypothetical protein AVDCRST_MAG95-1089 [uncultured Adhaeribacter sp.]|uniref:DUF2279 domain-containing protein n=1 Tax=uncultured Adhaeribacter sp. TaxID=448109 RepID=A0A6J4HUI9_9BACT|nr:MAG: hypothetical protein AVDCRST_MAG95-1089 [uncultured Adhaeribacter sp.]
MAGFFSNNYPIKPWITGLFLAGSFLFTRPLAAQPPAYLPASPDSTRSSNHKLTALLLGSGVAYGGILAGVSQAWYRDMPRTRFHFFNDNREWQQVDKVGHVWSAFHQSRLAVSALRWAEVPEKKAIWWGSLAGILLQSPIEFMDGYAAEYGASAGDLVANTVGSAAVLAQYVGWHEIRITPKYSFHNTRFAVQRPNVLGSSLPEKMLKDYNGQTYWLAIDVARFLPATSRYPKWLNIALGYGASEMIYNDPAINRLAGGQAYRQFYLAPDLNLSAIRTRSKFLKTTFYLLDMIHLPAPALEYNSRRKWHLHPVYF